MFFLALTLSLMILVFCWIQARILLSSFGAVVPEMQQLHELLMNSNEAGQIQAQIGNFEFQHSLTRSLARRLRQVFAKDTQLFRGCSGWLLDIDEFFHYDSLLKTHMLTRRVQTMPTLLTGMGIFFTFLGLTLGTFGLDPTDATGLTSSVKQLIGGMSLAFSTSLAGIGCSLWWTWRQKSIEQGIETWCLHLNQALRSRSFVFSEQDWYLWIQEEQRRLLERIPERLEHAFSQAIKQAVSFLPLGMPGKELGDHLTRIYSQLENQSRELAKALTELAESKSSFSGMGSPDTSHVLDQIQVILKDLDPIQQNQQAAVHGITQSIQALTESSENALTSQKTLFKAQEEMNRNLTMIREYWQTYREQMHNLEFSLNEGIKGFKDQMAESMNKTHEELDKILSESMNHFSTTLKEFDGSMKTLATVVETLNEWKDKPRKKGIFG